MFDLTAVAAESQPLIPINISSIKIKTHTHHQSKLERRIVVHKTHPQ